MLVTPPQTGQGFLPGFGLSWANNSMTSWSRGIFFILVFAPNEPYLFSTASASCWRLGCCPQGALDTSCNYTTAPSSMASGPLHLRLTEVEFDRSPNQPIDAGTGLFGNFAKVLKVIFREVHEDARVPCHIQTMPRISTGVK
jgi:hypothetical protein